MIEKLTKWFNTDRTKPFIWAEQTLAYHNDEIDEDIYNETVLRIDRFCNEEDGLVYYDVNYQISRPSIVNGFRVDYKNMSQKGDELTIEAIINLVECINKNHI